MNRCIKFLLVIPLLTLLSTISPVRAAPSLSGLSVSDTNITANRLPVRLRGINMDDHDLTPVLHVGQSFSWG